MNSLKLFRGYLLLGAVGMAAGLLLKPVADNSSDTSLSSDWSLPDYPRNTLGSIVANDLAQMAWWRNEQGNELAKRADGSAATDEKRRVAWSFRGVVEIAGERFALVAEDSQSPVKRYLKGASLPGGELLVSVEKQAIRFSLPSDVKDKNLERKLYAPAE